MTRAGYPIRKAAEQQVKGKLGFIFVDDIVRIAGEQFEGEPLLTISETPTRDHPVTIRGVDIHSRAGHTFSDAREALLDEHATRYEMGADWTTWTYSTQEEVADTIADCRADYREIFDQMDYELVPTVSM